MTHDGSIPGFTTSLMVLPNDNLAVVALLACLAGQPQLNRGVHFTTFPVFRTMRGARPSRTIFCYNEQVNIVNEKGANCLYELKWQLQIAQMRLYLRPYEFSVIM